MRNDDALCSCVMRPFEVLFDHGEPAAISDPGYLFYGQLGFPPPLPGRPWIFSNFVQSLDGIASFLGKKASGMHISRSEEDRWLMDLLRAHADAVLLGINTLVEETALAGDRGPVYSIVDERLRQLRMRLGRGRERNVFVSGAGLVDLARYRVFDGDTVASAIITTQQGAERLLDARKTHPHVSIIVAGEGRFADLPRVMEILRRDFRVGYLLCEGGPTLNGHMERAGLIDERFLTISPLEIGELVPPEQEPSALEAAHPPTVRPTTFHAPGFLAENAPLWNWVSCRKVGDHQFSRYRRKR